MTDAEDAMLWNQRSEDLGTDGRAWLAERMAREDAMCPKDLDAINEAIDEHNIERPDDRLRHVTESSPANHIRRLVRYLGVELPSTYPTSDTRSRQEWA